MKTKRNNGFFLTVEGGEGTGKSTLIDRLYQYLTVEKKISVLRSFEPGGTSLGEDLRKFLLHREDESISSRSELLLFLADRAHHVDTVILPALQQGQVVICDRFTDSSIAYQGYARQLANMDNLLDICSFATNQLVPDLTFYLDVDPEISLNRLQRKKDRMESEDIEFHKKVRQGYLNLVRENPQRMIQLDASESIENVAKKSIEKLDLVMKDFSVALA